MSERGSFLWRPIAVSAVSVGIAAYLGSWPGFLTGFAFAAAALFSWRVMVRRRVSKFVAKDPIRGEGGLLSREPKEPDPSVTWAYLPGEFTRIVEQLSEERNRFGSVLSALQDGVLALDTNACITLMNQSSRELINLSPEGLGEPLESVCDVADLTQFALERLELPGKPAIREIEYQGRILEVTASRIHRRTRLVLLLRDVSDVRRLESMRRDFVANVSHELKTPLTSIRAYVETLLDGGLDDSEVNLRFLRKIESNAARLSTLITELLTLSRIESGKTVGNRVAITVEDVLERCVLELQNEAESRKIELQLGVQGRQLSALAEGEAMQQIFGNLILNAVKYSEEGGLVIVRATEEAEAVRVEVEDRGIGIPQQDLPRIFERFYRVDKARSREKGGTGLGLSIVKHYVETLDGTVEVTSTLGEGSTFTVTLPKA
ncbi:MAG: ATP-binding protein [Planctomycetota bacterium]